jgi:uncharacterized protein YbbC (DUF1343 family)
MLRAMRTGLDRLLEDAKLRERLLVGRVGLLAHPASVSSRLVHASRALRDVGVRFEIIFGPEHGYGGEAQDMIGVGDARDTDGTPVKSLYGASFDDLPPKSADLSSIDVLVIDLQDVGSRYYTFVWTAVLAMRACAAAKVRVVVLDRPNPLGGTQLEGRTLLAKFRSFVGLEPVPIRHAMTLGEICAWRRHVERLDVELAIVRCEWDRKALAFDWEDRWVLPSPNMPTPTTALVYPGGCLLEGTNLSDGRGTTRPFEITGAPWVDGVRLARAMSELGLPGCVARPLTFSPTFHKHERKLAGGVQIHVTDRAVFRPVLTYVAMIALAHHQSPNDFRFRTERYEFVDDIPAFDLLTGDDDARLRITAGDDPMEIASSVSRLREGDADLLPSSLDLAMRATS